MAAMNVPVAYSVVVVRADKSRMMICRGVTKDQAETVKKNIVGRRVFPKIEIEEDHPSKPEFDLMPTA